MRIRLSFVCLALFVIWAPAYSQSAKAIDRFIGSWTEDESKAQLGSEAPLIFRRTSAGQLEELRGGQVATVVRPVVFDGKPRVIDPTAGRTVVWTQQNENTFQQVYSDKNDHVYLTRTISLSPDGRTLTQANASSASEGGGRTETEVFERVEGSSGLVGTWRMKSFKSDHPNVIKFERTDGGGLRVVSGPNITNLTLTGQPVPVIGPNVITGSMVASKLLPDGSIEATNSRDGQLQSRSVQNVSPDGRTLTYTRTGLDKNATGKPSVYVFVKQ